jgi:uncharacterized membrane protein
MTKVLLVGEQVTVLGFEMKGVDFFGVSAYKQGGKAFGEALINGGQTTTWIRTSHAAVDFPEKLSQLQEYDTIVLSDVGACTLLFHPEMLSKSVPHPNRLALLRDYVWQGGGLLMIGGWMSFAGIEGKAKYHDTFLEEALPVICLPYDDRQERPEGVTPLVIDSGHPILAGVPTEWPFFLGYNKVTPREKATTILQFERDPLLTVWEYGSGRSAAFTSDCAPHWGPNEFLEWNGYAIFWNNLILWLSGE